MLTNQCPHNLDLLQCVPQPPTTATHTLLDCSKHLLDLLSGRKPLRQKLCLIRWMLGMMPSSIKSICRVGHHHDIEVEDDVTAILEYANGASGVFVTTTGEAPGTNRLEIVGTAGRLVADATPEVLANARDPGAAGGGQLQFCTHRESCHPG